MKQMIPNLVADQMTLDLPVNVIILTGQSNARGTGLNSEATASELDPNPDLMIFDKTTGFNALDVGTNNIGSNNSQHGIELGLQSAIVGNFTTPVYLIKWAVTSTGIVEHLPGGSVYDELWPNYVQAGINQLINSGKRVQVSLVYIQGERDSNSAGDTAAYPGRLDTWVSQWQTNLGAGLPINCVEIFETNANDQAINTAFADKAASEDNLRVVETGDLTSGDNLHWDYASLKTIAQRVVNNIKAQDALTLTSTI